MGVQSGLGGLAGWHVPVACRVAVVLSSDPGPGSLIPALRIFHNSSSLTPEAASDYEHRPGTPSHVIIRSSCSKAPAGKMIITTSGDWRCLWSVGVESPSRPL